MWREGQSFPASGRGVDWEAKAVLEKASGREEEQGGSLHPLLHEAEGAGSWRYLPPTILFIFSSLFHIFGILVNWNIYQPLEGSRVYGCLFWCTCLFFLQMESWSLRKVERASRYEQPPLTWSQQHNSNDSHELLDPEGNSKVWPTGFNWWLGEKSFLWAT